MPPKKRQRVSAPVAASQGPSTPSVATPTDADSPAAEKSQDAIAKQVPELEPELWTDEQEIALFKGMIKWKPVGMHKHFRMIALSQHLRSHGHREQHTRPKGIWKKLGTLYNLKTLDEREDNFNELGADDTDVSTVSERYCEFQLPDDDFGDAMFERRLEKQKSSSPGVLSAKVEGGGSDRRASTVEDTEGPSTTKRSQRSSLSNRASEPRTPPALAYRGARGTSRGRGRGRGRPSLPTPRGRARADEEQSEESKDEGDEQEDDDDDDEDDNDEEEDESEEDDAPTPRGGRARGRGRGRGRGRRGRGRRRG